MKHVFKTAALITLILFALIGQAPHTWAQSNTVASSEVTSSLYLPLLTLGGAGTSPVELPAALVATWYSGDAPLNDFYNPQTGEWSEANGSGQMIGFASNGDFTYTSFIRVQLGTCHSEVSTFKHGKASIASNALTLTPSVAKTRSVMICGSTKESLSEGPFEPIVQKWEVTEGADGQEQLTIGTAAEAVTYKKAGRVNSLQSAPVKAAETAETAPTITYSTFVGEISSDYIRDTVLDSQGNLYVAGYTYSKNLGGSSNPVKGYTDAFVGKLNPDGSAWQWLTYIGGNQSEEGYALVVGKDAVWVTGYTDSPDYPTTANAHQRTFGGFYDVLLARLDPATGTVNYNTYFGLDMRDEGRDIAMDPQGNVYVTGVNNSGNVLALKVTGETNPKVVYNVQWGDDYGQDIGYGIAVDKSGKAYITGMTENSPSGTTFPIEPGALQSQCGPYTYSNGASSCTTDAFLSILNAEGTELLYSSLLGGSGGPELSSGSDEGRGIALDPQGNIYLTGFTYAADFPTVNAAYSNYPDATNMADAWVTKLTPNGKTILYSTYLGGDSDDEGWSVTTDAHGNAYVLGQSRSRDFPTLKALQNNLGKGGLCFIGSTVRACYDNVITKLSPNGTVIWSTYLGHGFDEYGYGLLRDSAGSLYVVGVTESPEYPTTSGAVQSQWGGNEDGFITKLSESGEGVPGGTVSLFLPLLQR